MSIYKTLRLSILSSKPTEHSTNKSYPKAEYYTNPKYSKISKIDVIDLIKTTPFPK